MEQTIIEWCREEAVLHALGLQSVKKCWPVWKKEIQKLLSFDSLGNPTARSLFDLGDHLSTIFLSTNPKNRTVAEGEANGLDSREQGTLSAGGAAWESLVCWYLNLCLIGRRTVVFKPVLNLRLSCLMDAITVKYNNFSSSSEADLIAVTFPDKPNYSMGLSEFEGFRNSKGSRISKKKSILNELCIQDYPQLEVHIIQCKTNWNDNAQIPMLWNMIYSADTLKASDLVVGRDGHSIWDLGKGSSTGRFSYSFVTVPTNKLENYKSSSTAVVRVRTLSGGNYWGRTSKNDVADSIKEMLTRNLSSGHDDSIFSTLSLAISSDTSPSFKTNYAYFDLPLSQ